MYSFDAVSALTVAVAGELGLAIRLSVNPSGWEEAEEAGLVVGRKATPEGRAYLRTTGKTDELEAMAFPRPPTDLRPEFAGSPLRTRLDYGAAVADRVASSWLNRVSSPSMGIDRSAAKAPDWNKALGAVLKIMPKQFVFRERKALNMDERMVSMPVYVDKDSPYPLNPSYFSLKVSDKGYKDTFFQVWLRTEDGPKLVFKHAVSSPQDLVSSFEHEIMPDLARVLTPGFDRGNRYDAKFQDSFTAINNLRSGLKVSLAAALGMEEDQVNIRERSRLVNGRVVEDGYRAFDILFLAPADFGAIDFALVALTLSAASTSEIVYDDGKSEQTGPDAFYAFYDVHKLLGLR